jgi:hypothetical protein
MGNETTLVSTVFPRVSIRSDHSRVPAIGVQLPRRQYLDAASYGLDEIRPITDEFAD